MTDPGRSDDPDAAADDPEPVGDPMAATIRSDDPDAVADDPEPVGDPMAATIRSDDEKRRREDPNGEADASEPISADAPDPTDAPDVASSILSRISRFRLAGSMILLLLAAAVVLLALVSPDTVSPVLGRGLGVLLVAVSLRAVIANWTAPGRLRLVSLTGGISVVGVLLLTDPDRWLRPIGWIVGVVMVIGGLRLLISNRGGPGGPPIVAGLVLIIGGAGSALAFARLFETILVVGALLAVAEGVVQVAVRSGYAEAAPKSHRRRPMLLRWVDAKSFAPESRDTVRDAVFFEGADAPARLARFLLLMLFASVISAAGVLTDSTAVVIGAMLIAPLITPMMGMGLALVTGWPNRLWRSTLTVVAGSVIAIGVGVVLAAATTFSSDVVSNSQIASRSSPGMLDLVIAIGAGAAGAYAFCRKEVSGSLPGVAVSIALVPPLSVVGVTAQSGDWRQASGTLLLFLTNLVAIILAGGAVFLLTGVVPLRRFADSQFRVRTALGAVGALVVVVVGGLIINGRQIAADAFDVDQARSVVDEWLGSDSEFTVTSVDVTDGDVSVVLTGSGEPPDPGELAEALSDRLGSELELDLQWIPRERVVVSSG